VAFAAAVVAALVFRLALPSAVRASSASDYDDFYAPVARRILAGLGPSLAPGVPATQYPPGYPLVLAASFACGRLVGASESAAALALGVVASGLVAVLLFRLASRAWGPRAAVVAPLAWTTYPLALWLTKQPGSELPFVVLLLAGLALAWRAFEGGGVVLAAGAGLVLGGAMLVRPIAIGVPLVVAASAVVVRAARRGRAAALAGVLVCGAAVAVLPWELWVWSRTGEVVLLSTGGLPSMRDGLLFGAGSKVYRGAVDLPPRAAAVMEDLRPGVTAARSVGDVGRAVAAAWRTSPLGTAELVGAKAARSWYATDSARHERLLLPLQLVYLALAAVGAAVAWRTGGASRALAFAVGAIVVYFWAMTTVVLSIVRYMVPAMALLFLLLPGLTVGRGRHPTSARA
jgi:4-amino-4-deoxy-L-arabinose transferase-like glycosyltransferase